jgi:hypothetical protein
MKIHTSSISSSILHCPQIAAQTWGYEHGCGDEVAHLFATCAITVGEEANFTTCGAFLHIVHDFGIHRTLEQRTC